MRFPLDDIALLRDLIMVEGLQKVAHGVGCSEVVLLRVTSGFGERCTPKSVALLHKFLNDLGK